MSGIEPIPYVWEGKEGFYISQMTEHDLLEVVEIEESCGLSRWGWDAYHYELTQQRNSVMLAARLNDNGESPAQRVKGFVAARLMAGELHINNVAVRQEYRRLGIAKTLLEKAIREGARLGARAAFLEVRAGNTPAQALYARCGFKVTGRRPNYYVQPTEDALIMELEISSSA